MDSNPCSLVTGGTGGHFISDPRRNCQEPSKKDEEAKERTPVFQMLSRLIDRLCRYANAVALISIVAMTLLINIEVFGRGLFGFSTLVSEEWPSYMLVYIIFFGLASTFKENAFIQVEILINRLNKRRQELLKSLCILLAIVFIALFDYQLTTFVLSSYLRKLRSISFSETPLFIPQIAMPIGLTLLGLQLIKEGVRSFLSLKRQ